MPLRVLGRLVFWAAVLSFAFARAAALRLGGRLVTAPADADEAFAPQPPPGALPVPIPAPSAARLPPTERARSREVMTVVAPLRSRVFRLRFTRAHLAFAAVLSLAAVLTVSGSYVWMLRHAEARVGELRTQTADQHRRLRAIDAQASALHGELRAIERQNEQLRRLIGERAKTAPPVPAVERAPAAPRGGGPQSLRESDDFTAVAARIERLRAESTSVRDDGNRLRRFALHVLNMRRLEDLARARVLAAIPSINPAGAGVAIRSPYGWRIDPWPEFHAGVDLDVDYGDPVRAAAAGTVVAAGDDGGYGLKVDIDHGNGYHSWYCHLSRVDVRPGQYVVKAQHIALVGSTGESTGPHLHYQIEFDGRAIDPTAYLTGVPDRVLASLR